MPKWLVVLLAIAALAGVIVLEQMKHPPVASPPAAPPAVIAPVTVPPVAPQTPSAAAQTPSSLPALSQTPSDIMETPAVRVSPQSASEAVSPPTTTAAEPLVVPAPDARWVGMPVHEFLLRASGELVRLSPESVTYLGISGDLGMRDDHLDPLTVESEEEYYDLAQAILNHLATYDLSVETPDTRLNAEIYGSWLRKVLSGRPFADNGYAVSSYMDSYPTYIEWFLTSLHPLGTLANVDDYLSRLSEISKRFRELQVRLAASEALHSVPPRFMLDKAVEQLRATGETPAEPCQT
jgi:hypothetical protein